MFARALLAFLILPGIFAGAIPFLIIFIDPWRQEGLGGGFALLSVGLLVLSWCVRDFYVAGKGTLAPWRPPERLVVVGLYRYVRNPMYIGVLTIVAGFGFVSGSLLLGAYLLFLAVGFHLRVVLNEEPRLESQFGEEWRRYAETVPRWLPGT